MIESSNGTELTRLLERARSGNAAAQGQLLELYRNYLRFLARAQIGSTLRVRLDSSDLVQETLLDAHRGFEKFCGTSEAELVAWLRRILVRNLADQLRHDRRQKRTRERQESLEAMLERSSLSVHEALARGISSPSAQAVHREQAVLLADAISRLPADDQEVIVLRHVERLKFEKIALRMGRSAGAVRMLWARALERLRSEMEGPS